MCTLKFCHFLYRHAGAGQPGHPYCLFFVADPQQPHRASLQFWEADMLGQDGCLDVYPDWTVAECSLPASRHTLVLCGVMHEAGGPDIRPGSVQAHTIRLQMIGNLVLRSQNGRRQLAECALGLADDFLQLLYDVPQHDEVLGVRQLQLDQPCRQPLDFSAARQTRCTAWFARQG